jgi:hypothetical protein
MTHFTVHRQSSIGRHTERTIPGDLLGKEKKARTLRSEKAQGKNRKKNLIVANLKRGFALQDEKKRKKMNERTKEETHEKRSYLIFSH